MITVGQLDRRITIEYPVKTQDTTYGTDIITWTPLAYAPGSPQVAARFAAQVQDVLPSRSEAVQQGLVVGRNQSRLRMRWRPDVTSEMRVRLYGDTGYEQVYQIVGGPAMIGGRKQFMEMVIEKATV